MKVKLGNLKSIIEGLSVLASERLPIKHAYWIGKVLSKLTKEFQEAEKSRYALCVKHCKKDAQGNPVTRIENENKVYDMVDPDAFVQELNELWGLEIDVKFLPIPLEQLEGIKIDTATILKLDGFIVMEEE